ncbi:glycosyltransferase family 4 protein [Nanchangia anserum]|uniref:Glycosyltransferase family 4 protein n=1 Tax=Nanchangia anserum TaxID=2692125 RepID=A0A8I0KP88_9ACTO|nr:glycosyltransferase family 4 protein [Nanchangia anserum]MBD3688640.1 glycosyltransferase family 4 protein [Nanchangia anserum]QOX82402.1 glycosyltransferase family 4 protein [Nanchangia anserum]
MRIVEVVGSAEGGMAAHVRQVVELTRDAGNDVILAAPASFRAADSIRRIDVEIGDRPGAELVTALRRLRRVARGADVVHAHGIRSSFVAALALPRRVRLVSTWHSVPGGDGRSRVSEVMMHVVARRAAVVLTVSEALGERARGCGARRVERALVPPPSVSDGRIERARAAGIARADREILTIARLAPQKGIDLAVEASALLAASGCHHAWHICGDGPLRAETEDAIARSGAPVHLDGHCDDVASRLMRCTVFVQTSRSEGQPVAVQEALAAGCAIVATDVGGTREVLGNAGEIVATDAHALARTLSTLMGDEEGQARLRQLARSRATRLPRPADVYAQLERIYAGRPDTDAPAGAHPGQE